MAKKKTFWMEHRPQKVYGRSRDDNKNRMTASCVVCSELLLKDGEEETISLRRKLEDVLVLEDTEVNKEPIKTDSSEEFANQKRMICFFGKHKNQSHLKPEEAIFLCYDCKFEIASFYMLHVQEWHEQLSPRSKKKMSLFADEEKESPSCVSSYKIGRRRRRRRLKKTGRSYQKVLRQRYEARDPTVGPLGLPSGRFDYLVEYAVKTSQDNPIIPTGWD